MNELKKAFEKTYLELCEVLVLGMLTENSMYVLVSYCHLKNIES